MVVKAPLQGKARGKIGKQLLKRIDTESYKVFKACDFSFKNVINKKALKWWTLPLFYLAFFTRGRFPLKPLAYP